MEHRIVNSMPERIGALQNHAVLNANCCRASVGWAKSGLHVGQKNQKEAPPGGLEPPTSRSQTDHNSRTR